MLWDAKLKKFIISRDVKFDESISAPQSEFPIESESKSDSEYESIIDESDEEETRIEELFESVDDVEDGDENDADNQNDESEIQPRSPLLRRSTRTN